MTTAATKARANKTTSGTTTRPDSRVESATKAEEARLIELVNAVKAGMELTTTHTTAHEKALSLAEQAALVKGNSRVATARALAELMGHPAVIAKGGKTKGQPSLMVAAQLTGYPRTTLRPLWEGAEKLIAKKWAKRTTPPTQQERDLIALAYGEDVARVTKGKDRRNSDSQGEAKGTKGKGTKATKGTVAPTLEAIVESLSGTLAMVQAFTKDHGLTESQFDGLGKQLDLIHDALESAVAQTVAAEADAA